MKWIQVICRCVQFNFQMGIRWKSSKLSFRMDTTWSSSGINGTWVSFYFSSSADINWWFLIWDVNNQWTQQNTRIWYFIFVCWLFDKLTGFFDFFFLLTRKKAFFFFFSSFFLETRSTCLIQLPVTGILCRGLKICGNILLVMCLIYMDVWFAMTTDATGHIYAGSDCNISRKDPDNIGYRIHFWQEFEIRENRGNIFHLTDRYWLKTFFLFINWKTEKKKKKCIFAHWYFFFLTCL